tara:strand:+ start:136 stop:621 length:486 start_codon:yes stop_codon:yes gene_type:complete
MGIPRYYKKPKPETIQKRKEEYAQKYKEELKWLSTNKLIESNNFLTDMALILKTGKRPFSEKMHQAVLKAMKDPRYDLVKSIKLKEKAIPTLEKIDKVLDLVNEIDGNKSDYYLQNFSALPFIMSIREQFESRLKISPKQMQGLNKVYKKYKKKKEGKNEV